MHIQDIHKTIGTLSELYSELNKSWITDRCTLCEFQIIRQEEYREAYEALVQADIEKLSLNIISHKESKDILLRLRNLIEDNLQIYNQRQRQFDGLDFFALHKVDEKENYDDKLTIALQDLEEVKNYEYSTDWEKEYKIQEFQQEVNKIRNEYSTYRSNSKWIIENYYAKISELSHSFLSIIDTYFPVEKESSAPKTDIKTDVVPKVKKEKVIDANEIFVPKMYEKLSRLEEKLIEDKLLSVEKEWIVDKKELVIFLLKLLDKGYFLAPQKNNANIRHFFNARYKTDIGQVFEPKRRKENLEDLDLEMAFINYPF